MSGQTHSNVTQQTEWRVSTKTESEGHGYGWEGQSHEVIPERKQSGPGVGLEHTLESSAIHYRV